jgi:NIPSNAP
MIVEMKTYLLKPATASQVQKAFAEALPERVKISPMAGYWNTEVGTLNQVIQLWPYENLAEREQIEEQAAQLSRWPPDIRNQIVEEHSQMLSPAPFSPPLAERVTGDIYEIRSYLYRSGTIPKVIELWAEAIEARTKLSPLAGCWYSETGQLNRWVHIWPYRDAAERQRLRAESTKIKGWPPPTAEFLIEMRNALAVAAPFSPLR